MSGIDRSKFKPTKVAAMQQQDKEVTTLTGKGSKDRAGYIKIKPGKNMFRVFPPHPVGENEIGGISPFEPKSTVWLPMMVEQKDEQGKTIIGADNKPMMKEGTKTVFNSRIHGGTEKDLVEEYFKMAEEWAKNHKFDTNPEADKKKRKTYTDKLWGNFKANIQGIRYNHNWVFYAKDLLDSKQPFGLVEAKPSIKDGINKVVNIEASNQPIGTEANDPFTDVDEGRALVIMYNDKADKASDYYSVSIDTTTEPAEMNGRKIQIQKVYPLSEEDLEMLMKFPSLYKTFRNSFKKRDFLLQFEGLEFFDKKNGMGIFDTPEFQEVIEEISAYYPDDPTPTEEEIAEVLDEEEKETETEQETESEEVTDKFALMTRDELKKFNTENGAGILVKPSMSDEDLRNRLREWEEFKAHGGQEQEEPTKTEEPKQETPIAPVNTTGMSAKEKLEAMKARKAAQAAK